MQKIIELKATERNTHVQMLINDGLVAQWPFITPAQVMPMVLSEALKQAIQLRYDFGHKNVMIVAIGEVAKYLSEGSSIDSDRYAITIK